MWKCEYCRKIFPIEKSKTNHKKSCSSHPNRLNGLFRKRLAEKSVIGWKEGRLKGVKHTQEAKNKIAIGARKSKHRRLLKSCRIYKTKTGEQILLDSSWEEALAIRLDQLEIKWIRPKEPLEWIDLNGNTRNYFPDFWLPKEKIYLDPKNPEACKQQLEKINWLMKNRNDIIILKSLTECKNFTTSDGTP